ncbi:MAG: aminotransferase class IV [Thermodesulfovibrio sp.]|nr:aminotransferase class IV [Thermodesulfovibrio sp.]
MENRTLFFGEGLFETIFWKGKTKKLHRHYERLKASAKFFQIPYPDFETFYKEIEEKTKGKNNLYVKVCLLSEGESLYYSYPQSSEILVIAKEYTPDRTPKKLCLSGIKRHSKNPVIYHKTMNYLPNILAKRESLLKGFDDAVMLNEKDEITECSASNIVILKDKKLLTPAKDCGLLLGTTIQILIEKMNVKEERLKVEDLYNASALFIINSLTGALPVIQFMEKTYSLTPELINSINSIIEEENTE